MCAAACCAVLKVPYMWTFTTASKSSGPIFSSDRSRTMPALFTRMSMRPYSSIAVWISRPAASKSVTDS